MRRIELQVAEIKAKLDIRHVATKAWVLGSVLAGTGVVATIAAAVLVAMGGR